MNQAPSLDDPVVGALSEGVGGPLGSHAGRARWWTPLRVILLLTALTFAVGMLHDTNCYRSTWGLAPGQSAGSTGRYQQMCYSDLPYLYTGRGFAELSWPYDPHSRYQAMEYPVGIAYWAYDTAVLTHLLRGSPSLSVRHDMAVDAITSLPSVVREIRTFVIVNALGFAVLALISAWLLAGVDRKRPWDAAAFALSPVLAATSLVNWDMIAVAMTAGAIWAWSRGRPVLTGVLIGLGTATKLYPLFLLGAVAVLCFRSSRWKDLALCASAGVVAWLAVDLPALVTGAGRWAVFWHFNSTRAADLGSVWLMLQQISHHTFSAHTINVVSWMVFGLWCIVVFTLGALARRTPSFAELGFVIVAGFLIVNKVYSPQYVLWLLPLAVIARPRWRDQIVWQAGELAYFAAVWWYLGGWLKPGDNGQPPFYWFAIILRIAVEAWLAWRIIRSWYGEPAEAQEIVTESKLVAV